MSRSSLSLPGCIIIHQGHLASTYLSMADSTWLELSLYEPFCKKIEAPILFTALTLDKQVNKSKSKNKNKKMTTIKRQLLELLNLMLLCWIKGQADD